MIIATGAAIYVAYLAIESGDILKIIAAIIALLSVGMTAKLFEDIEKARNGF